VAGVQQEGAVTPLVLFAAWIVIGLAVLLLSPQLPAWLGFALPLGVVAYGAVQLVTDGAKASEAALVLVFAALAAAVWWRDLRGRARGSGTRLGAKPSKK
jgi:uncharacterized PurR-regulated membrane protein YhhQ (DUF165 family)